MNTPIVSFFYLLGNRCVLASMMLHLASVTTLIVLGHYSLHNIQASQLKIMDTASIDIEIVEKKQPKPIEKPRAIPINTEPVQPSVKAQETVNLPEEITPVEKVDSAPIITTPKQKLTRYEQLLSHHFAKRLTQLPKNSTIKNEQIYIWVKLDAQGNIRDFGFKPNNLSRDLVEQLDSVVSLSNPVPAPPATSLSQPIRQYLIPIRFR